MTKRGRLHPFRVRSLGAIVLIVMTAAATGCREEERHGGRPTSYWVAHLTSPDSSIRRQAAEAFAHDAPRTPEAIDALLQALSSETDADIHATIAEALGALGSDATSATPQLVRLLEDDHLAVRQRAASALGTVGRGSAIAAAALARALRDPDHDVRAASAQSLGRLGPSAGGQTDALLTTLRTDRIGWVRLQAVVALGRIGREPGAVVPVLVARTQDEWSSMREESIAALGAYGPAAEAALPSLRAKLRDSMPEVRTAAARAVRAVTAPPTAAP